ncbi:acid type B receptor subunit 2 [Seminavis robusta]|uniref:Acid type B receptor subunit 2 n=1 Tax=Seminavis robusta TaxID=568900 RepID=A0A9N8HSK3_9STRA|nr:acid type B receptor subunit 2 [Seminavis robusta]|eukprot:Sro1734_g294290.1 acid type B receptor subunit 2 (927) ;mRNA; r:5117-7897
MSLLLSSLEHYDALLHSSNSNSSSTSRKNLQVTSDDDGDEIAICNLAALIPFSLPPQPNGHVHYLTDLFGLVAPQLALAVQHLNTGDGSIVRDLQGLNDRCNIRFTLEFLDTGLVENVAVDSVLRVTDRAFPPVCAFQGASRSSVSMYTAAITGLRGYPQISAASTSPLLSSNADAPQLFPLFGRTIPSDDAIAVPIMEHFQSVLNIQHLAVLYVNDAYGTAFARGLHEAAAPGISIKSVEIAPGSVQANVERAVRELKQTQYQYIFAILNQHHLFYDILLQAFEEGIAGTGRHTWFFSDASLGAILAATPPIDSPLQLALQGAGVITASAGVPQQHNQQTPLKSYIDNLNEFLNSPDDLDYLVRKSPHPDAFATTNMTLKEFDIQDPFTPFIYDSMIALGLGACNARASDNNDDYFDGHDHFHAITRTTFVGTSGPVIFDPETGSREPSSAYCGLHQIVANSSDIANSGNTTFRVTMASLYDHGIWKQLDDASPFVYADGSTVPPSDLPHIQVNPNYLGTGWRVAGYVLCGMGMALALGLALWTRAQSENRVIRASQPFFLTIICLGVATFFASIIPLGVDEQIATETGCTVACNAVIWLLSIGFCVTFSAMFTKTQRVNKIFQNPRFTRIKVTPLDVVKPMMVCLGANFVLLALMAALRPVAWTVETLAQDDFGRDTETRGFCDWSHSIPFLVPLALINLGCLFYAMVQAYEARGISIEFAESEWIFRCMLVIALAGFLSFPVLVLIHENNNAFYFFFSATIWITGSLVLLLMFVPKILFLRQKESQPSMKMSIMRGSNSNSARSSLFHDPSTLNFSSSEDGLLVLSHPKTEAELRDRVVHLEARLKKFADRCSCRQASDDDLVMIAPILDAIPEQPSHDNNGEEEEDEEEETSSLTPEGIQKTTSNGEFCSTATPDDVVDHHA